jgi:hypothetical protein
MPDWDKYRIRRSEEVEIETVRHIAHVPTAKRIIEDGRIKSGLIYDQSVLNRSRISVVWLSANTWANGSMYGTVAFEKLGFERPAAEEIPARVTYATGGFQALGWLAELARPAKNQQASPQICQSCKDGVRNTG